MTEKKYELKYPKELFTKKEVLKEKAGMPTPELWQYSETDTNHILTIVR